MWKVLITFGVSGLLLLPSFIQAVTWTSINLIVDIAVLVVVIAIALHKPRMKWVSVSIAALIIAIPPYPNWIWVNGEGWHFRIGYKLLHPSDFIPQFMIFYPVAICLLLSLHWAVSRRREVVSTE